MASLTESKNEWCLRLLNILSPTITQGLRSIYEEAVSLCKSNNENDKYLMTFQNFLTRVPKWNSTIIDDEKNRIIEQSACTYLEDLITCVHIIHLKSLTCVRVGQKQKKIDIDIPSINKFIHTIYINVARKIYTMIYLFEKNIVPLETQKRNRELECVIKECILDTVRDSIPVENILRSYIDETIEEDVEIKEVIEQTTIPIPEEEKEEEEITNNSDNNIAGNLNNDLEINKPELGKKIIDEEVFETPKISDTTPSHVNTDNVFNTEVDAVADNDNARVSDSNNVKLSFSDVDMMMDVNGAETNIEAPKTIKRLEEISSNNKNNIYGDNSDDEEEHKLSIGDNVSLDFTDVNDLNKSLILNEPPILEGVEILT